jgi:WD40 repeat protein/serine/threonine protein kinase
LPTEIEIDAVELTKKLEQTLKDIVENETVYFVASKEYSFVLGPSEICGLARGLVGQEHGWPIKIDITEIKDASDILPCKQRFPYIFKNGKCLAMAIKVPDYELIKKGLEKGKHTDQRGFAGTMSDERNPIKIKASGSWVEGQVVAEIYHVLSVIGEGSFGIVYKVRHQLWQQDLAVKVPNTKTRSDEGALERFDREAKTWTQLGLHPNIVTCYYVREINKIPRIFLEYVKGGNLKDRIGYLTLEQTIDFGIQICRALDFAHRKDLIHRDLKPENCLITQNGLLKVTDFGLVKLAETLNIAAGSPGENGAVGTPEYMAPEQWGQQGKVTKKVDIWALGAVLYEMCSGKKPFEMQEGEPNCVFQARMMAMNWAHDELPKIVPYKLVDLIESCLLIKPDDRPESALFIEEKLIEIYQKITKKPYSRKNIRQIGLLATSLNNRGVSRIDLKETQEALESFSEALKLDPSHPEAVYNQAMLLWQSGQITDLEAVDRVKAVRVNLPGVWKSHYLLGLMHMARQDANAALCALEEAQSINPQQSEVRAALQKVEYEQENWIHCMGILEGGLVPVKSVGFYFSSALVGYSDGKLSLWKLKNCQYEKTITINNGCILCAVLAEDPTMVALLVGSESRDHISVWNPEDSKCFCTFQEGLEGRKLRSIAFSTDGKNAITAFDETAQYWELSHRTGKMRVKAILKGHKDSISALSLSHHDMIAITGSWDNTAKIWDLNNGEWTVNLEGHSKGINSVALSDDDKLVLTGSLDQTARLWDAESGKCIHVLKGHSLSVDAVAISRGGKIGLTASKDRTIRLWDLQTGQCIRTLVGHQADVACICLSSDDQIVISGSVDSTARVWSLGIKTRFEPTFVLGEIRSLEEQVELQDKFDEIVDGIEENIWQENWRTAADLLAKGRALPGYERHPRMMALAAKIGQKGLISKCKAAWCVKNIDFKGDSSAAIYVSFSQNAKFAVTSSKGIHEAYVWNLETRECMQLKGHTDTIFAIAFSLVEMVVLTSSADGTVRLWDAKTGKCLRVLKCTGGDIRSIAFSPDGKTVITASTEGTARIWDIKKGVLSAVLLGHEGSIHAVSFSPDGRHVLTGSADLTAKLWGVRSGKCLQTLIEHTGDVDAVAFSSDGKFALTGSSDCTSKYWNLESGERLLTLQGHSDAIRSLAFSPNDKQALTGSVDTTAILWNLETGRYIHILKGHNALVSSVDFSPDGQMALTGSWDNTAKIWSTKTGKSTIDLTGHCGPVDLAVFSEDRRYALTASYDKTLRIWECDWEYQLPEKAEWSPDAKPFLASFLTNHLPYQDDNFQPLGGPEYTLLDFEKLFKDLSFRGFGWLSKEGVKRNLDELASEIIESQK